MTVFGRKACIFLLILSILTTCVLPPVLASTDISGFDEILNSVKNDPEGKSLVIYTDKTRDLILFYMDDKLQVYRDGISTTKECGYIGNLTAIHDMVLGKFYSSVQVSPDKNLIVFYDESGKTFIYSVNKAALNIIPLPFAKVIWNTSGNDYEFLSKQEFFREGMGSAYSMDVGLYLRNSDGTLKQVLGDDKNVGFIGRKTDGIHFSVRNFKSFDELASLNIKNGPKEEVVYSFKTGSIQNVPYFPENAKIINHKGISEFTSYSENIAEAAGSNIYFYGNYVLAPSAGKYIRFNKTTGEVKQIPSPIGIYKGNIYYFKTLNVSGPVYKMNISTLAASKTSIGCAASYGYVFYKNFLYFLNPQPDSQDTPYALNLDNGILTRNSGAPALNEYHVFPLKNNNRLCAYFNNSTTPLVHLEDASGRIIIPKVNEYYDGYFYQTGTSQDSFPVINKVDTNGKVLKAVFKASNKYVQLMNIRVSGNRLYFTANSRLYVCDMSTGKYSSY